MIAEGPSTAAPDTAALASAEAAGLHYLTDQMPGIARTRAGKSFRYRDSEGRVIRDDATIERIRKIGIPPAWTDVWISPDPESHLQATGRDARGRKQYRYHRRWREVRDETKYGRMLEFALALPRIRERVERDLARPGLPREKVLATVVRLLETTLIRVGNEEYARDNKSFGLTTMRDGHVRIEGGRLLFHFRGKSGKRHRIELQDRRLARVVKACRDIPGQELFQYLDDDGQARSIGSADVNAWLREVTGSDFTAKDFRTWAGTVLASLALQEFETFDSQAQAKKNVVDAVKRVAERLGNTPAVCRRCYIHPAVLDAYLEGTMLQSLRAQTERVLVEDLASLEPEEAAVFTLLQQRLQAEEARDRARDRRSQAA